MERGLLIELSPQETMALIEIADAGVWADTISEKELNRLRMLGLVEQRGISIGLTAIGPDDRAAAAQVAKVRGLGHRSRSNRSVSDMSLPA